MAILNFPPTAGEPIDGSFTYTSDGVTYSWDGYKWTADTGSGGGGDANHSDGPTPPSTGELADQWYNTDDGRLYTYTADSSGTLVWIDASPDSIAGGSGGGSGGGTTDIYGTAKAWGDVAADGTFNDGLNIASVTKFATGKYRVVFTSPMPTINYGITIASQSTSISNYRSKTVNGFEITTHGPSGTPGDEAFSFAVFDNEPITVGGGSGGGGTTVNYNGASAWGNFKKDGTINGSFNIASVTKTATGSYDVVFTTPMPSNAYSVVLSNQSESGGSEYGYLFTKALTNSGFTITGIDVNLSPDDFAISFTVHAENAIAPQSGVGADSWGNVAGNGTLESSFNVASVSRFATGTYDVVFTVPMPTSTYSLVGSAENYGFVINPGMQETTGFSCRVQDSNGADQDGPFSFTVHASSTVTPTYTWTRDGTTLKPANDGDDVDLGNIQLNADGSAEFAGTVLINGNPGNGQLGCRLTKDGFITACRSAAVSTDAVFAGYTQGSGTATSAIFPNGSATFKGILNVETAGTASVTYRKSNQPAGTLCTWNSDVGTTGFEAARFGCDGSAAFAGTVTAAGHVFNLEADDPANYTTTIVDGEETQVYNGPTLDVKERILNLISRLDAIEANEQIDDATDTSLLQLVANASARLDSIEARLTALEGGNN